MAHDQIAHQIAHAVGEEIERRWERYAIEYFQEERRGRLRLEALVTKLLEKGGMTDEERAAIEASIAKLEASRGALQDAANSAQPTTKE